MNGDARPRRVDFHDDPQAPAPTALVPSVNVAVTSAAGELLLIRRDDNGNWSLPGGAVELGESLSQAGVRETLEETGISCEITGLSGIYTDPGHVILYTSDGEVRQEFSVVLTARPVAGSPAPSPESPQVAWVAPEDVAALPMDQSMALRVRHVTAGLERPYLG